MLSRRFLKPNRDIQNGRFANASLIPRICLSPNCLGGLVGVAGEMAEWLKATVC